MYSLCKSTYQPSQITRAAESGEVPIQNIRKLSWQRPLIKAASHQLVISPGRPALDAGSVKARHHRQVLDLLLFEGL